MVIGILRERELPGVFVADVLHICITFINLLVIDILFYRREAFDFWKVYLKCVSSVWLYISWLCSERTKKSILDYSVIEDFAMEHGIFDEKDVRTHFKSIIHWDIKVTIYNLIFMAPLLFKILRVLVYCFAPIKKRIESKVLRKL